MIKFLLLAVLLLPSLADAHCMSLYQARRLYPDSFLTWRGHHCWFVRGHPGKHYQHEYRTMLHRMSTLPVESPIESPPPAPPATNVDQVLTETSLIMHGIEQLPVDERPLTQRLDDTSEQVNTVVSHPHPALFDRERMLRALGIILFSAAVLLVSSRMIYRVVHQRPKRRKLRVCRR